MRLRFEFGMEESGTNLGYPLFVSDVTPPPAIGQRVEFKQDIDDHEAPPRTTLVKNPLRAAVREPHGTYYVEAYHWLIETEGGTTGLTLVAQLSRRREVHSRSGRAR